MVKTATTPPEEDEASGILISDLSNPIWGELRRLLEDQEQAAIVLDILVQAITSRAIEEDLPEASRAEHVDRASALVASKLSEIEELTGATDLQRRPVGCPLRSEAELGRRTSGPGRERRQPSAPTVAGGR